MVDGPFIELKLVAPFAINPIGMTERCCEIMKDLFAVLGETALPTEHVIRKVHNDYRFDSATLIYTDVLEVEWIGPDTQARVDGMDDEITASPRKLLFRAQLKSKTAEFLLESQAVFYSPPDYTGHPGCWLDNRAAVVRSSGLNGTQLDRLADLLRFPRTLADGQEASPAVVTQAESAS